MIKVALVASALVHTVALSMVPSSEPAKTQAPAMLVAPAGCNCDYEIVVPDDAPSAPHSTSELRAER